MHCFSLLPISVIVGLLASGCGRPADTDPALLATPEVTLDRAEASVGGAIEMNYRFFVRPGVSLPKDYTVFVHLIDADGQLMWTDDHQPDVPTSRWKAGETVGYSRTMFIPKFPYEGATDVHVGLYSPATGERVKMDAEPIGQRKYRVASFDLQLQSDDPLVVFTEGWHDAEASGEDSNIEWRWTRKVGTLTFKNPMRDATLFLQLDQPLADQGAQHVDVRLGESVIDAFELRGGKREVRTLALTKDQFGSEDTVTLTLIPDKTFVPAAIPSLQSSDFRELGVRVFRVHVQSN
ncbi:MAG: hypothetical protein ABL986_14285 [Vicinamibacterales bacterium]